MKKALYIDDAVVDVFTFFENLIDAIRNLEGDYIKNTIDIYEELLVEDKTIIKGVTYRIEKAR